MRILSILPLLLLTACSGSRAQVASESGSPVFVRAVAPFEVLKPDGEPYDVPFLGGLNVPRPQLADLNADGKPDLFVQEAENYVMHFEQTDSGYVWRTDQFEDLEVGEWYRFADLDADGDLDLLTEQPYSYIRVYRNVGTPETPRFTLAVDTLRDASGTPLFSDRQNIPNLTDIDCDGLPDLFIGRVTGTVMRYESIGLSEAQLPQFELVTERFEGIEIIGQIGTMHGANTLTFADVDGDGDQDLFWGDFFEPSLLLIENTGTCASPSLRTQPTPYPLNDPISTSGYNAPTLADVNGDGRLDLMVGVLGGAFNPNRTAATNLYFYTNREDGYHLETRHFLDGIDIGNESTPALGDLDNDGDLDLLLANKIDPLETQTGRVIRFENIGTPERPRFQHADTLDLEPAFHYAPTLGDLDDDGDLDLIVGTWNEGLMLYRNDGTPEQPEFVLVSAPYLELTRGSNSAPTLGDLDDDGDLDLMIGEASGTLNYYRNDGSAQEADFVLVSDEYGDFDIGRRSAPSLTDFDLDDDLDLIVGTETGDLLLFRNEGNPQEPNFVADSTFTFSTAPFATPKFGDIDNDGDLDLFSGNTGGGVLFFERR